MNATTLLDFFSQLNKQSNGKTVAGAAAAAAAAASNNAAAANLAAAAASATSRRAEALAAAVEAVKVKEEPLSDDDMRLLQKDRQKKDNHNMSELFEKVTFLICTSIKFCIAYRKDTFSLFLFFGGLEEQWKYHRLYPDFYDGIL